MSVIAELTIVNPVLFDTIYQGAPDLVLTVENFHYVADESGDTRYVLFWWVSGCEFEAFERAAERDSAVRSVGLLAEAGSRRMYRVETKPLPEEIMVFPLCRKHGIAALAEQGSSDGFWLRVRAPSRENVGDFVEDIGGAGADIRIERIYADRSADTSATELTDRQREALALAVHNGYFETPSETTLDELAADLDITPQTLSKHIRVGVKKLAEREISGRP
ncbi:MAG: helix-turn-helix domain-containing protein [Salinigranum sp.]